MPGSRQVFCVRPAVWWRSALAPLSAVAFFAAPGLATAATPRADFNGDGLADLVIGALGESYQAYDETGTYYSWTGVGAVNVSYGRSPSVPGRDPQQITQADHGGTPGTDYAFGSALASGDFDGDGYSDLAVGTPGATAGGRAGRPMSKAGLISVIYGSRNGLLTFSLAKHRRQLSQYAGGGRPEANDGFGSALASGDFDGDGVDDLAVGAPRERVGTVDYGGAVNVLYGDRVRGLGTGGRAEQFTQNSFSAAFGRTQPRDGFGHALGAGDLDGDGREDLAIGVPGDNISNVPDSGSLNLVFGARRGLGAGVARTVLGYVPGTRSSQNRATGRRIGVADLTGDGQAELIASGSHGKLDIVLNPGVAGTGSQEMVSVPSRGPFAVGDFDGSGTLDLATCSGGFVNVVVKLVPNQPFTHATQPLACGTQPMGASDRDGDGNADLLIGRGATKPYGYGSVDVYPGRKDPMPIDVAASYRLTQWQVGSRPEPGDGFGSSFLRVQD